MSIICPTCGVEVPSDNFSLHEVRCRGQSIHRRSPQAVSSVSVTGAQSADVSTSVELGQPADNTSPLWTCSTCTCHNSAEAVACIACGTLKAAERVDAMTSRSVAQGAASSWSCPQCTYENVGHGTLCEVCFAPRDGHSTNPEQTSGLGYRDQPIGSSETVASGCDIGSVTGAVGGAIVGGAASWLLGGRRHAVPGAAIGGMIGTSLGQLFHGLDEQPALNQDRPGSVAAHRVRSSGAGPRIRASREHRHRNGEIEHLPLEFRPASRARSSGAVARTRADHRLVHQHGLGGEMGQIFGQFARRDPRQLEELMTQIAQHESETQTVQLQPANEAAIAGLPTHSITAEEVMSAPEEHKVCTICMEPFQCGEEQRMLPCFHRFHCACVDQWLRRQGSCPICKHRIDGP